MIFPAEPISPARSTAHPPSLRLVPIYCGSQAQLLAPLAEHLRDTFGTAIDVRPPDFDPELAFDPSRGQYNSRLLLTNLLRDLPAETSRVLGVTGVDLFIPVLTFVFGEAQLDGRAAVVSTHRLANELYGLPPSPGLLFDRLVKEAVHELGHTFDLVHCRADRCVMISSTYVEEIDLKSAQFCDRCRARLTSYWAAHWPLSAG
jgi:archaemetzincin